jgi:ribonuclease Z
VLPEAGPFSRVKPKLAVYSHILPVNTSSLLPSPEKTYSGPMEVGEDLMTFEIGEAVVFHRAAKVN